MAKQQLRILWVDDDRSLVQPYSNEAYDYGLYLTHCECWDDAEDLLDTDFDRWDAIILDAKCKHHKDSNPKADKFLTEAINAITRLCAQKGRLIPWYILSAGGAEVGPIENSIPDERKKWDGDWDESKGRNFYLKTEDREMLYRRIYYHVTQMSQKTQLRTLFYRDVFNALPDCQLDDKFEVYLEDLLLPTIVDVPNLKENDQLWKLRKCVEFIFRSLIVKWQLLPTLLLDNTKKEKINLTSACFLLLGRDTKVGDRQYRLTIPVDNIVAQNIYAIVQIAGNSLHTGKNNCSTDEHLRCVNNAPYMVRGYILALCDIVLWMRSFVQQYPNPEINATFVEELSPVAATTSVRAEEESNNTDTND